MNRRRVEKGAVAKLSFYLVLALTLLGHASGVCQFNRTTGLVDIPTAYILPHRVLRIAASGSIASGEDPHSLDLDLSLGIGLGPAEIGLSAYTRRDWSAHLALELMAERGLLPALGVGVQEISYRKWISSVGGGDTVGFADDQAYWGNGGRPSERFSAYLVATKDFDDFGSYTLGIGRGRFVGYGPKSHLVNTDNLFREDYTDSLDPISDMAFGLFAGAGWRLLSELTLMVEFDGRDFNTGLKYCATRYELGLAATKLEWDHPRIVAGVSVNVGL